MVVMILYVSPTGLWCAALIALIMCHPSHSLTVNELGHSRQKLNIYEDFCPNLCINIICIFSLPFFGENAHREWFIN